MKLAYISYHPLLTKGGSCPTLATSRGIAKVEGGGSLEKYPQYSSEWKEEKEEERGRSERKGRTTQERKQGERKEKKLRKKCLLLCPNPESFKVQGR